MKIYIDRSLPIYPELRYIWAIFAQNIGLDVVWVDDGSAADFKIMSGGNSDYRWSTVFEKHYLEGNWAHHVVLNKNGWIELEQVSQKENSGSNDPGNRQGFTGAEVFDEANGKGVDWLLSAFYMLNCLQEYPQAGKAADLDEIGRFKYSNTYQAKWGCVAENRVQYCFDQVLHHPKLARYKKKTRPTRVFLSHDIDSIYGAFREDRNFWLKRFNPLMAAKVVLQELFAKPGWFTIDRMMQIEEEHALKSTFFWLVNKGKVNERELNADYDLHSPLVWGGVERIKAKGWDLGIHKSISADSLADEMQRTKFEPIANRHHYLKFQLPHLYDAVEQAGLQLDASLGFAEQYGFRNSYALPFVPFDLLNRRPYSFVEAPLHLMDGTFQRYLNLNGELTSKAITDFMEQFESNAVISILWHNSFCTDYKYGQYFNAYQQLLGYLREKGVQSMSPQAIYKEFRLEV